MVINIQNKETEIKSLSAWDDVLNLDDQLSAEEKILQLTTYCKHGDLIFKYKINHWQHCLISFNI